MVQGTVPCTTLTKGSITMELNDLESFLKSQSYIVSSQIEKVENLGDIIILKAQKGKVFKKRILVFIINTVNSINIEYLVKYIKTNNPKNDLCLALCNTNGEEITETMYTVDNGDGVCIIHFVYQLSNNEYIYNTDFSYHDSNIVKNIIRHIVTE